MKRFFDFTKWEILESYYHDYANYVVHVRMNKATGLKYFKVIRITNVSSCFNQGFDVDKINELTNPTK
jgi:hypothetical protein